MVSFDVQLHCFGYKAYTTDSIVFHWVCCILATALRNIFYGVVVYCIYLL